MEEMQLMKRRLALQNSDLWLRDNSGNVHVPLTRNMVAFIDIADVPLVSPYLWGALPSQYTWYATTHKIIGGKSRTIYMHRVIMGESLLNVDHRDRNGLNNRRSNLRFATQSQNLANTRRNPNRPYRGIERTQTGGWLARISVNEKVIKGATFRNPVDAAKQYDELALKYFGEFAVTNFPPADGVTAEPVNTLSLDLI